MNKIVWYECRYCDSPLGPSDYEGDKVCRSCGAEWNPVRSEQDTAEFAREMQELDEELTKYDELDDTIAQDFDDEDVTEEDLCMGMQPCDGKCEGCPAYFL